MSTLHLQLLLKHKLKVTGSPSTQSKTPLKLEVLTVELDETPPLHSAKTGRTVKELIAAGANPKEADSLGQTHLHKAHKSEIVKLLLAANPQIKDSEGKTPLDRAKKSSPKLITILQAAMATQPK